VPWALPVLAVAFTWGLAVLSGSGSSPVQTFAVSLLAPLADHPDAVRLGALAMLGGAFGRTSSPIAAVVIYGTGLGGESPVMLVRRLLPALLAGAAVAIGAVLLG
jgi:DcuC family C4-dicarboxylate transporter